MTPKPTGRLLATAEGVDLVFARSFRAPAADVWASLTDPERTARWFGPWEGHGAPGRTVRVRMAFEEGEPWSSVRVDTCEPPRRLAVTTQDAFGSWRLEARITESGSESGAGAGSVIGEGQGEGEGDGGDGEGGGGGGERGVVSELRLIHHLAGAEGIGEVGPGWEYYLDLLVVSREGGDAPRFEDYYPALKESYERLRPLPPEE
ncbi:SRPBCC family protein [Streptomyces sp. JNUCC 64]